MSEPALLLAPLKSRQVAPRIWRNGHFVVDTWTVLADTDPVPRNEQVIVPFDRWRKERGTLLARRVPIGIALAALTSIDAVAGDLATAFGLVTLPFPKFSDGRAYSTARRLREAGYTGELRATGDVLLDQMPLMLRSGFDAFEITNAATIAALEARPVPAVSRVYQAGQDAPTATWQSRRRVVSA